MKLNQHRNQNSGRPCLVRRRSRLALGCLYAMLFAGANLEVLAQQGSPAESGGIESRPSLRLTGLMQFGETQKFSLKKTESGQARWVQLGGYAFGYEVVRYDDATKQLLVHRSGTDTWLTLHETSSFKREFTLNSSGSPFLKPNSPQPRNVKSFDSLSESQQKLYNDPAYIPALREMNIEIPKRLILEANRQKALAQVKARQKRRRDKQAAKGQAFSAATASQAFPRSMGPFLPKVSNSLTAEEKAIRAVKF